MGADTRESGQEGRQIPATALLSLAAEVPRAAWRQRPASLGPGVEPRDQTEIYLRSLWEEVLRVAPLGVEDDFFALGGDSLGAASLFAAIETDLGVQAPLSILLEQSTISRLAAVVASGRAGAGAVLVPLRSSGSAPPVFCIHPAGIEVFVYRDLVEALGPEQPVYGLRAGWIDAADPPGTVPDIASSYLDAVRAYQPHGPYRLVGFCLGGVLAYEMACQLRQVGEAVALLAIADMSSPAVPDPVVRLSANVAYVLRNLGRGGITHAMGRLEVKRQSTAAPAEAAPAPSALQDRFTRTIRPALEAYRPSGCRIPAVVAISDGMADTEWARIYRNHKLGWDRLLGDDVEILRQRVSHSELFRAPAVATLARRIAAAA
jgi:thioesterase domain-containing protein/acyl carrier protein